MSFPGAATNMMQSQGRPTSVHSTPGRTTGGQRTSESASSIHSGRTAPPGMNVPAPPGPPATGPPPPPSSEPPRTPSLEPPPTPSVVVHPPPPVETSAAQPSPPSPPSPAPYAGGTGKAPATHSPTPTVSSGHTPPIQDQDNAFPMTPTQSGVQQSYMPHHPAYQAGESSTGAYGTFPRPPSSDHNGPLPYRPANTPDVLGSAPPVRPPPPNPHASNTLWSRISGRNATPIPTPPPVGESDADRAERFQNDNIEQTKRNHAQGQTGLYASTVLGFGLLGKMIPVNNAPWVPTGGTMAVQPNMTTGVPMSSYTGQPTSAGGLPVMPRRFNPNGASDYDYTANMLPDYLRPTQTTDPNGLTPEELAQLGQPKGQLLTFPPLGQTQTQNQQTPTPGQQPTRPKRFNAREPPAPPAQGSIDDVDRLNMR